MILNPVGISEVVDAVVIGAGPAGLGAAIELKRSGLDKIVIFERNSWIGGVLKQCIHTGFGVKVFNEELTGPQFIRKIESELSQIDIDIYTNTAVIEIDKTDVIVSSDKYGLNRIHSKAVIIASGCRERTRENIEVSGSRPSGIFSAGQAQTLINLSNLKIGKKVLIQGSGDIGLIMARRLTLEGVKVLGVFERLPYLSGLLRNKVQCLDHFNIPLFLNSSISEIHGRKRVEYVTISFKNEEGVETETRYECDTVLFSVGLIPELDIAENSGVNLYDGFHPAVNELFQSNVPNIFICGNSLHINDLADSAYQEGRSCGKEVAGGLRSETVTNIKGFKPFQWKEEKDTRFNSEFFRKLNNKNTRVCILCPKGCILEKDNYGCIRGKEYFESNTYSQKLTSTVNVSVNKKDNKQQIPIVSLNPVLISDLKEIKKQLDNKVKNICLIEEEELPKRINIEYITGTENTKKIIGFEIG